MEITINKETLTEKLIVQITKNVKENIDTKDLTNEEKQANMVISKRAIERDANTVADLVILALA